MKFRTDFVTNSSSSGFVAVYAVSKTGQAVQLYMAEEYIEVDEEMLAQVLALESMEDWYQWLHDLEEANDCKIGYLPEEEWDEDLDPEMLAKKAYQSLLQGVIETIDDLAGVKVDQLEDESSEFVDQDEVAKAVGLDLDELELDGLDEEKALIVGYRKVYFSEIADRTEGDIWEDDTIYFTNVDLQGTGIELSETSQEGQIAVSYQGKCRVLPRSQVQNHVNELLQQKK